MEEEMDEELEEEESPSPPKKQPTQKKESPVKKQETKKDLQKGTTVDDKVAGKDKVEVKKLDDKGKPGVGGKEDGKKKEKEVKKHPTLKVQQVKVDEKEEQAKKSLFEEKQEKQWAAVDRKGEQSPVKKGEEEED